MTMTRRHIPTRLTSDEGFSFVEVMTVSMLLGVILAAAYLVMGTVSKVSDDVIARGQAQEKGQLAIEKMTRELRMSYAVSAGPNTSVRFDTLTATTARFFADVDHDLRYERVTYSVSGGQLTRRLATSPTLPPLIPTAASYGVDSAPEVLATVDPAVTTVFTYLDVNRLVTSDDSKINAVQITLRTVASSGAASMIATFPTATVNVRSFQ
jgi:prepilin-type N-terminal cleavage/methylation domain-containing protein